MILKCLFLRNFSVHFMKIFYSYMSSVSMWCPTWWSMSRSKTFDVDDRRLMSQRFSIWEGFFSLLGIMIMLGFSYFARKTVNRRQALNRSIRNKNRLLSRRCWSVALETLFAPDATQSFSLTVCETLCWVWALWRWKLQKALYFLSLIHI